VQLAIRAAQRPAYPLTDLREIGILQSFLGWGDCRRALSEARAHQAATTEILHVISTAPTDPQPVFDLIAESAVKLCGAEVSNVSVLDGEWVRLVAIFGLSTVASEALRRIFPMQLTDSGGAARAIRECAVIQIPDIRAEPGYKLQEPALIAGFCRCSGKAAPSALSRSVVLKLACLEIRKSNS
jgi:hypothetical protein